MLRVCLPLMIDIDTYHSIEIHPVFNRPLGLAIAAYRVCMSKAASLHEVQLVPAPIFTLHGSSSTVSSNR
jgi:hypothetical protein